MGFCNKIYFLQPHAFEFVKTLKIIFNVISRFVMYKGPKFTCKTNYTMKWLIVSVGLLVFTTAGRTHPSPEKFDQDWKYHEEQLSNNQDLSNSLKSTDAGQDPRIVNGWDADITERPYQVSIQTMGQHFCGGSIISEKFIVTAAHCFEQQIPGEIFIRAGSTYSSQEGQDIIVNRVIPHPRYYAANKGYDIAILELRSSLTFGRGVQKIQLADSHYTAQVGREAVVSGWGDLVEGGQEVSEYLKMASVTIMDSGKCQSEYSVYNQKITSTMVCASSSPSDACQGDSGGPLTMDNRLVGIVSWGIGCGSLPGVYSNVSELRGFIRQVTGI